MTTTATYYTTYDDLQPYFADLSTLPRLSAQEEAAPLCRLRLAGTAFPRTGPRGQASPDRGVPGPCRSAGQRAAAPLPSLLPGRPDPGGQSRLAAGGGGLRFYRSAGQLLCLCHRLEF